MGAVGTRAGIADPRATGIVWARWSEIVGPAIAANAEPTSLRDGVLRVRATTPTWATELTYLASEIRSRANELAGAEVVSEVRVWTGPGPVTRATPQPATERFDGGRDDERATPAAEASPADPASILSAFERARAAWLRRRSKRP